MTSFNLLLPSFTFCIHAFTKRFNSECIAGVWLADVILDYIQPCGWQVLCPSLHTPRRRAWNGTDITYILLQTHRAGFLDLALLIEFIQPGYQSKGNQCPYLEQNPEEILRPNAPTLPFFNSSGHRAFGDRHLLWSGMMAWFHYALAGRCQLKGLTVISKLGVLEMSRLFTRSLLDDNSQTLSGT